MFWLKLLDLLTCCEWKVYTKTVCMFHITYVACQNVYLLSFNVPTLPVLILYFLALPGWEGCNILHVTASVPCTQQIISHHP